MPRGTASTLLLTTVAFAAGVLSVTAYTRIAHRDATPAIAESHEHATTHGEWVKYANGAGDSIRAYVAYPERRDKAPTVIVIHEIFGLTEWEPTMADRFAGKGYIAIAPDLLSSKYGASPASVDSGRKLVATLNSAGVNNDLDATYKYVNALPAARKDDTGVIGFCWGGGTVWQYAMANPNLKAAVVCYGPLPQADTARLANIKAPVLGVFGQNDNRVNAMIPVEKRILGARFVADSYMNTGHGFLKPTRTGYGTPEYDRALKNIDEFFGKHLEGK